LVFTEIPKILNWSDTLVEDAIDLYDDEDSSASSPDYTFDTSSVNISQ
jgi:hypothetical protein